MGETSRPAPATSGGRARERGSAVVEFVFLGVVLLIPVVYLIITASQLQAASYAAVGAADHAAKVFVAARSEGAGSASARDAVDRAVGNMGLGAGSATMEYRCSGPCLDPGTTVTVRVSVAIGLPLMPPGMGEGIGTASSESTSRVDRFG